MTQGELKLTRGFAADKITGKTPDNAIAFPNEMDCVR